MRGVTILYDQATEGIMDPVAVAMSSAFAPFPGTGLPRDRAAAAPQGRIRHRHRGQPAGHVLTDRQVIEGCNVIVVAGSATPTGIAEDTGRRARAAARLWRADLTPVALAGERAGRDLTLVGIADPQPQAAAARSRPRRRKLDGQRRWQPSPQLGFAGAAALDAQGRFSAWWC